MQVELFDHLLLLAAVICAATLVRLLRGGDGIGRGYAIVVGIELVWAVFSMGASRFSGTIALSLVVLTVALPWALERLSRWAFARGYLAWVGRLSGLRAMLMPGAGLSRQLPILEGLSLLDRKGVDAALAHFRRLADEAEDGAELAMIHEQIVSMLFHGQRWDEGIAHYERRFHAGYAALRPSLALGLLRAYGESGRIETAAGLLRELEDGPIGDDPNTAELLGQARLTFLAYAGAVAPVDEVVQRRRFAALGLTPATAELFKGIALVRAGERREAVETLSKVEELAGPRDRRVLEAARAVLEPAREAAGDDEASEPGPKVEAAPSPGLSLGEAIELPDELRVYVEVVAARLQSFLVATPPVRRHERPIATYAVMVALSTVYGVHLLRGGGGIGLMELGALSEDLWRGGAWGRVFTSAWIHMDLVGLLFDVYAIWLAGQIIERMLGPARMAAATVLAGLAGMAASVLALPLLWQLGLDRLAVVAPTGGNLMAVGAITAALWLLLPSRTPALASRPRRNLVVTLSLLLVANLLTSWPGVAGVGVAPIALLTTIAVASLVAIALPLEQPRWLGVALGSLVGAALVVNAAAAVLVIGEDPETYLVDHRSQRCEIGGLVVHTSIGVTPMSLDRDVPFNLPIVDGLLDTLELRDGSLVQLAVYRGALADPSSPALFELVEGIDGELSATAAGTLPEPFAEIMADDPTGSWHAADLWRNGLRVGRVIERRLELPAAQAAAQAADQAADQEPATVMLIASPAEAVDHAPSLYAAMLREAEFIEGPEEGRSSRIRCTVE
ncbi:Rhomboid family protein [Enhygromyxa salina]|uniref:Rhomboid family protein n=1 Tax=Enhygromyxa salina TaxID=215803 RepID=A0A2S9XX32_9BACT|nr:rhomboid family intramembrane serine protease [Enhygromyxa salina]PRP97412.1 Rhomboid family protein [Enhygromyxa salina]